jgi:hypothetical protein
MLDLVQEALASTLTQVVFSRYQIPFLKFDASLAETHKREASPTEFEVENGQTISDHVVIKPFNLKLQVVVSDTPLGGFFAAAAAVTTSVALRATPNPALIKNSALALAALPLLPQLNRPSATAYDVLLGLQADRLPVDVSTSLRLYRNLWIKSISIPRDPKTGAGWIADIELVQLLLVNPLSMAVTAPVTPDQSALKHSEGEKAANKNVQAAERGFNSTAGIKAAPKVN